MVGRVEVTLALVEIVLLFLVYLITSDAKERRLRNIK